MRYSENFQGLFSCQTQAIYLDLCQNNGIKFLSDQDRLGDVLIDIAANQRGITENTRLLFPD